MFNLISINWTGQQFTDEQLLVLRNVAAQHLRMRKKQATIHFKHALCEGELTRKKEGSLGTFNGTFFHADLGTAGGERWTADFLLPRNSEWIAIGENSAVISVRALPGNDFGVKMVDAAQTTVRSKRSMH